MGGEGTFALLLAAVAGCAISIGSVIMLIGDGDGATRGSSIESDGIAHHTFCPTGTARVYRRELGAPLEKSGEHCR